MAKSAFAVHLGAGLYIDVDGSIYQENPPSNATTSQVTDTLPVGPS